MRGISILLSLKELHITPVACDCEVSPCHGLFIPSKYRPGQTKCLYAMLAAGEIERML